MKLHPYNYYPTLLITALSLACDAPENLTIASAHVTKGNVHKYNRKIVVTLSSRDRHCWQHSHNAILNWISKDSHFLYGIID